MHCGKKHTPKSGEKEETRQQRTRTCPVGTVGASTGEPILGKPCHPLLTFSRGKGQDKLIMERNSDFHPGVQHPPSTSSQIQMRCLLPGIGGIQ